MNGAGNRHQSLVALQSRRLRQKPEPFALKEIAFVCLARAFRRNSGKPFDFLCFKNRRDIHSRRAKDKRNGGLPFAMR